MKKKVIFIAFSDIQIEDWKQYSKDHSRLYDNEKILKKIYEKAEKYKCPVLFGGDLFDNPYGLSNRVLNEMAKWFKKFKRPIYAISGNHDQQEKNTLTNKSPTYMDFMSIAFDNFVNLDNGYHLFAKNETIVAGIPYYASSKDLIEAIKTMNKKLKRRPERKILLLHTHLPGAKEPSGLQLESDLPSTIYRHLKGYDLVLSGHIHKPQKIFKNTLNMGATHNQRTSDEGCKMGFWLIYDDLTYKFIDAKAPMFKYIEEDEEPEDDYNFYIKVSKEEEYEETEEVSVNFKPNSKPETLAKEYLKAKNIKSKAKLKTLKKYLKL